MGKGESTAVSRKEGTSLREIRTVPDSGAVLVSVICEMWWRWGDVPGDQKGVNVRAIHKKGPKEEPGNYRPLSLTPVPGKVVEQVLETVTNQMKQVVAKTQHRFTKGGSCQTNLVTFYNRTTFLSTWGEQLMAACHKRGPSGIDAGPHAVQHIAL